THVVVAILREAPVEDLLRGELECVERQPGGRDAVCAVHRVTVGGAIESTKPERRAIACTAEIQAVVERRLTRGFVQIAERAHRPLAHGREPAERLALLRLRVYQLGAVRLVATHARSGNA